MRAWIEIEQTINVGDKVGVALFMRAWIEIKSSTIFVVFTPSPSS